MDDVVRTSFEMRTARHAADVERIALEQKLVADETELQRTQERIQRLEAQTAVAQSRIGLALDSIAKSDRVRKISDARVVGVVVKKHYEMPMVQVDFTESGGPKFEWVQAADLMHAAP